MDPTSGAGHGDGAAVWKGVRVSPRPAPTLLVSLLVAVPVLAGCSGSSEDDVRAAAEAFLADWAAGDTAAAAAATTDPESVVGLAIYHRPRLDGNTSAQLPTAQALLPGQEADLRLGDPVPAGDLQATTMTGTLGLGDGASLQLRVLALDSAPRQLLVFFAPPSVFAERADTFDQVTDSLAGTG